MFVRNTFPARQAVRAWIFLTPNRPPEPTPRRRSKMRFGRPLRPAPGAEMPDENPAPASETSPIADPNERTIWGPLYKETPPDPFAPDVAFPAEPWNTVTASFFVLIVLFWAWRLRGQYQ